MEKIGQDELLLKNEDVQIMFNEQGLPHLYMT